MSSDKAIGDAEKHGTDISLGPVVTSPRGIPAHHRRCTCRVCAKRVRGRHLRKPNYVLDSSRVDFRKEREVLRFYSLQYSKFITAGSKQKTFAQNKLETSFPVVGSAAMNRI